MNQTFTEYTEDDCNSVMNTNVASYFGPSLFGVGNC